MNTSAYTPLSSRLGRSLRLALALLGLALGLTAHAQADLPQAPVPVTASEKADDCFLEATVQKLAQRHAEAYELFRHVLRLNPRHVGALYALSTYAHVMHQDSLALDYLLQASRLAPMNYDLRQALVSSYMAAGRQDDAVKELEQMARQYPDKTEILLMLVDLYTRQEDYAHVISALDRVEVLEGKNEQISIQKFRTYSQMKDEKRAFAEMQALADEYPNDLRYRVMMAEMYLDQGKNDAARKIYEEVQRTDPDDISLLGSLMRFYDTTGEQEKFQQTLERLIVSPRVDAETRFGLVRNMTMQALQEHTDTASMTGVFRRLLALPQEDDRTAELFAQYLISANAPQEQVKPVLEQTLLINPENEAARMQLLMYATQEEDHDEILRLCRTASDINLADPVFYYNLGMENYLNDQYDEALAALRKGLTKTTRDTSVELITNMYAVVGDLHHQMGNDRLAFEAYDSCLLYRPDDAMVLNNYAYYLSLRKQDLQRAAEMSLRSLEKEPRSTTFLDTYAWILFQQKRYEEARVYADSVLSLLTDSMQPADATSVEHAGDIYAELGQTEHAVQLWEQALRLFRKDEKADAADTERVTQKIRRRKYIEVKRK